MSERTEREILEEKLKSKLYEVRQWAWKAEESATGTLPDGSKYEDFDGAFSYLAGLEKATQEAKGFAEQLFNTD